MPPAPRKRAKRSTKPAAPVAPTPARSIMFGPGEGKTLFRVRQSHVAGHYKPLIARKAYAAVKLDLVLRAIALLPKDAGARKAGFVLRDWSYEDLHDLAKSAPAFRVGGDRGEKETRHLKRKWVGNQMDKLVAEKLVRLEAHNGRPTIIVLRDDGSGLSFDDPGEAGGRGDDRYLTIRGSVIASGRLATWKAPQLAAYFAAIYAEYHQDRGGGRSFSSNGTGSWWRQLAWFNNAQWYPKDRVLLPFSKSLLEDGLHALISEGLIARKHINRDPLSNKKLVGERVLYTNQFARLDTEVTRSQTRRRPADVAAGQEPA
jgi:hypothetical protein